jgi:hypothetical protein
MAVTVHATSGLTQAASPLALITGSAPQYELNQLIGLLSTIRTNRDVVIDVNTTTGLCAAEGVTLTQAVSRMRDRAEVWIDYGSWPFGQCQPTQGPNGGFTRFLQSAFAGSHGPVSPPDSRLFSAGVGLKYIVGFEAYAGGLDRFDFFINPGSRTSDWAFATNMIRGTGLPNAYPYAFGLPTSATRPGFHPMPGAPTARISVIYGSNVHQTITIWSAFAIQVGRGWYFQAQPEISPVAYADFIADTLHLPRPTGRLTTPAQITPKQTPTKKNPPPSNQSLCSSSIIQTIARLFNVSCTEAELLLAGFGITLLLLLIRS